MESTGLPPIEELPVAEAREQATTLMALQGDPEPVGAVRDIGVPGPDGELAVRLYSSAGAGRPPLIVYLHGGGWVIGSVELVDRPCRAIANETGCVVASVEYRLSPETKFPGAVEDAHAATSWLAEHAGDLGADPDRVLVAGDSAGGNLAAVTALLARDRGGPALAGQVLYYPVTAAPDHSGGGSYEEMGAGYMLTRAGMEWFWGHYTRSDEDGLDPLAAPLHAPDLSRLPPALVVLAGYDPLRDEGLAYAAKLEAAGVPADVRRYDGQMHGFVWLTGALDAAHEAFKDTATFIAALPERRST